MTSVPRSSNCTQYTDTVSLLVDTTAVVPGDEKRCSVPLSMFSCQTKKFEAPDDATLDTLKEKAIFHLQEKGCDVAKMELINTSTNLMGAQEMEYSAQKLAGTGLASNCFVAGNDPNHATHRATAVCTPQYDMTDINGNRVRDTNKKFHANLHVCDITNEAAPQVNEDLRKVAAHNAAQNGYTLDRPEDLACTFAMLPIL